MCSQTQRHTNQRADIARDIPARKISVTGHWLQIETRSSESHL
jgi:hypothetical protein